MREKEADYLKPLKFGSIAVVVITEECINLINTVKLGGGGESGRPGW